MSEVISLWLSSLGSNQHRALCSSLTADWPSPWGWTCGCRRGPLFFSSYSFNYLERLFWFYFSWFQNSWRRELIGPAEMRSSPLASQMGCYSTKPQKLHWEPPGGVGLSSSSKDGAWMIEPDLGGQGTDNCSKSLLAFMVPYFVKISHRTTFVHELLHSSKHYLMST